MVGGASSDSGRVFLSDSEGAGGSSLGEQLMGRAIIVLEEGEKWRASEVRIEGLRIGIGGA